MKALVYDDTTWRGFDRVRPPVYVTYEKADQLIAGHEPKLSAAKPDFVVGIARSGVVLAAMIAQRLGREFYCLRCQRHDDVPRWIDKPLEVAGVALLVDDFVSRGQTMRKAKRFLQDHGYQVITYSLFYDLERSKFIPDISSPTVQFVRFAWERREVTNVALQTYQKASCLELSQEEEAIGFDLDGILLPDVDASLYQSDLKKALALRDELSPFASSDLPCVDFSSLTIITGRPNQDMNRTRHWLDRNGFSDCKLVCRDESLFGSTADQMALHKARAIQELGLSIYFESELLQATLIAEESPTTETIWWGRDTRLRIGGVSQAGWQGPTLQTLK